MRKKETKNAEFSKRLREEVMPFLCKKICRLEN